MASIVKASGAWHLRLYSSVNVQTGVPNAAGEMGKPIRRQQSVKLVRCDDTLHKSERSTAVILLANAKHAEILAWEKGVGSGEEIRPSGDMTVSAFFDTVFMPWIEAEKEASTIKGYKGYWNAYLKEHFNHSKTLKGYEPYMGTNLLEKLATEYSENTVSHARALASAIFTYACAKGYITSNPWRDVKKTVAGQEVEECVAYTQKEIEMVLDALEHVSGREEYSARMAGMALSVGFYAGLRPSEIAGLRWENVTEDRIVVKQAYVIGATKGTKTGKTRTVVMLPQLRNRMKLWSMTWHYPTTGWVFPNQTGDAPININDLSSRVIKTALQKFGIDWLGFYSARRGFGTMLVLAGATLDEVADAMGNSPDVVFKHYFKDKTSTLAAKGIAKLAAAMGHVEPSESTKLLTEVGL